MKRLLRYLRRVLFFEAPAVRGPIEVPPGEFGTGNIGPPAFSDPFRAPYKGVPCTGHWGKFHYHIIGPFINIIRVGDLETCGPETVHMLNLAYRAGQRNPESLQNQPESPQSPAGGNA